MAGFTQAECLAFIKNDTKILILYMVKVAQGEVSKRPGNALPSLHTYVCDGLPSQPVWVSLMVCHHTLPTHSEITKPWNHPVMEMTYLLH